MKTRTELLKARQEQCEWKQTQGCPITEFEKCIKCKAIHTKPLGLASLIEGGWEGIQKKQQGENMKYNFICKSCGAEEEKEIAIKDYDEEKEKQVCSSCGGKMQRLLEWEGIATIQIITVGLENQTGATQYDKRRKKRI